MSRGFDDFDWDNIKLDIQDSDSEESIPGQSRMEFHHEFLTGAAGTGKTFEIRRRMMENPEYAKLCASTGIAALNMGEGVTTIHSLFGFYDLDSLKEAFTDGRLARKLRRLYREEGIRNVVLDEISMFGGEHLDYIHMAFEESAESGCPIGLILTGDFCQLPPVKAKWAFEAECWNKFADHTTRLDKVWRQSDKIFLDALNQFRRGHGREGLAYLGDTSAQIVTVTDENFDGTTIMPRNDMVDRYNERRLLQIQEKPFKLGSFRWGRSPSGTEIKEWKDVPEAITLKKGALVMLLANDVESWRYANGSLGHVEEFDSESKKLFIRLIRDDSIVGIGPILRQRTQKDCPPEWEKSQSSDYPVSRKEAKKFMHPMDLTYWDSGDGKHKKPKWIIGEILYYPVRLAWASTVHKSQGLSLDKIQVDIRDRFFGSPAMSYVAYSRCKSPEGLRIICDRREQISAKCCIDEKIREWL